MEWRLNLSFSKNGECESVNMDGFHSAFTGLFLKEWDTTSSFFAVALWAFTLSFLRIMETTSSFFAVAQGTKVERNALTN